jgi:micrococcal nuclease
MIGGRKKVRLLGIDAPDVPDEKTQRELAKQGKNLMEVRKQGRLARNFLKKLINKKEIKLEYDVQKEDKDGRTLAYVYKLYCSKCKMNITEEAKEIYRFEGENIYLFLNAFMVQWGYAVPSSTPPNTKYDELFMKLYQEARENERGLWKPQKKRKPWRK